MEVPCSKQLNPTGKITVHGKIVFIRGDLMSIYENCNHGGNSAQLNCPLCQVKIPQRLVHPNLDDEAKWMDQINRRTSGAQKVFRTYLEKLRDQFAPSTFETIRQNSSLRSIDYVPFQDGKNSKHLKIDPHKISFPDPSHCFLNNFLHDMQESVTLRVADAYKFIDPSTGSPYIPLNDETCKELSWRNRTGPWPPQMRHPTFDGTKKLGASMSQTNIFTQGLGDMFSGLGLLHPRVHDYYIRIMYLVARTKRPQNADGIALMRSDFLTILNDGKKICPQLINRPVVHIILHLLIEGLAWFGNLSFIDAASDEKEHQMCKVIYMRIYF